jgi:hypothetical protein
MLFGNAFQEKVLEKMIFQDGGNFQNGGLYFLTCCVSIGKNIFGLDP